MAFVEKEVYNEGCFWEYDPEHRDYDTACGAWFSIEGSCRAPRANDKYWKYCPNCGNPILLLDAPEHYGHVRAGSYGN